MIIPQLKNRKICWKKSYTFFPEGYCIYYIFEHWAPSKNLLKSTDRYRGTYLERRMQSHLVTLKSTILQTASVTLNNSGKNKT